MPEDVEVIEVCASRHRPRISSRLTKLRKKLTGGRRAQREEFECIMEIANDITEQDPHALPALIRLIGRSAQARAITTVLRHPQDAADCGYDYGEVLFDISKPLTAKGLRFDDLKREVRTSRRMRLGVDVVLPWPWERGRLINSMCNLRPGGKWGKWRQDYNHCVELWLPLGIGWVIGGNHSLTAGIVHATGTVKPEITYDISRVYRHVVCDGIEYRRVFDNTIISPVSDLEIAAIFEIGRLMHKRRVT